MAIIFNNPNGQMSGSVGANVYTRSASGKSVMRSRVKPINPKTLAQSQARTLFSQASSAFVQLSDAAKLQWQNIAASKGIKQGRWMFIKLYKQVLTINQLRATAGTGLAPNDQPAIDISVLNTLNAYVADFNITNLLVSNAPINFSNVAFNAADCSLDFDLTWGDGSGNIDKVENSRNASIAFLFEITVKKGQSKYLQSLVSTTELTLTPAGNKIEIRGLVNDVPRTNYKYSPMVGDTIKINIYLMDPSANCERILYNEFNVVAA